MAQPTTTLQTTTRTVASWKLFWRLDAVANLITGDIMLFAAGQIIDLMGMTDSALWPVRMLGALLALYGLWQLWAARTGTISRQSYLLAAVDMDMLGFVLIGALIAGVEFNTTGTAITIGLAVSAWIAAAVWWVARKQST